MGKYLILQFKRILRILPLVLCVVLVLFGGLMILYGNMIRTAEESEENSVIHVALSGYTDDPFIEMGMSALQAFDSTRFSIEIEMMDEADAISALEKGDIAAYVVIPDGFVDAAMYGEIMPIKYVSTSGAVGLVSIFKDEISGLISEILVACQKGAYGVYNALEDNGEASRANKLLNDATIRYVEFVFIRSNAYSTEELGISDGLGLDGYLFCGLTVLFLLLTCLPFAPIHVRQDHSLGKMLAAKRRPLFAQLGCEYLAYLGGMMLMTAAVIAVVCIGGRFFPIPLFDGMDMGRIAPTAVSVIPITVMITAFSFMLYELTDNLISGVLLQFFAILAMGFVSGCMYPVFFFPESIQKLAACLPTGIARTHLAGCITDSITLRPIIELAIYSLIFLTAAYLIRRHKVLNERR